jgi:hypothetical protein
MSKKKLVVTMTAVCILAFTLGAMAVLLAAETTTDTGTRITRVKTLASEERFTVTAADGVVDLPGARHRLILPRRSLVLARFSAATRCIGDSAGPCGVPIAVIDNNAGGSVIAEMLPTSGPIDSAVRPENSDNEEGHFVERSIVLPAGDYDFQVGVVVLNFEGGTSTFQVGGWHFTIERVVLAKY